MAPHSIEIIYEDAFLLALNKPAQLHSTARSGSLEPSVAGWLEQQYPALQQIGGSKDDKGLVQRLDFETSGLLLAAKSQTIWDSLHSQLCSNEVKKSYLVLCGSTQEEQRTVTGFVGQRYRRSKKMSWSFESRPGYEPVETRFRKLGSAETLFADICVAELTHARRHQVRISAAAAGTPLCGDSLYGSKVNLAENLPKFLLHALRAELRHPVSAERLVLSVRPPLYFSKIGWNTMLTSLEELTHERT